MMIFPGLNMNEETFCSATLLYSSFAGGWMHGSRDKTACILFLWCDGVVESFFPSSRLYSSSSVLSFPFLMKGRKGGWDEIRVRGVEEDDEVEVEGKCRM